MRRIEECKMRRIAMAAMLMAGLVIGLPVSARAATSLTVVTVKAADGYDWYRAEHAYCPAGKVVYGGGADLTQLSPGITDIKLRSATPFKSTDGSTYGFMAIATNSSYPLGAGQGTWGLTVTAICGPALPGYEIKTATSAADSAAFKSVQVNCSSGRVPLATGATVRPSGMFETRLSLFGTSIDDDPNYNTVGASAGENSTGQQWNWDMIVTAVCAYPPPGYRKLVEVGPADTATYKGKNTHSCPAGTQAFGGGGFVGYYLPGEVHLLQFATRPGTQWQSVTAAWAHPTKTWYAVASTFCAT